MNTAAQVAATAAARIDAEAEMLGQRPETGDVIIEVAAETGFALPESERAWRALVRRTERLCQIVVVQA